MRTAFSLVTLVTAYLMLSVAPATAHAGLTSSDPRAGQRLTSAPEQVRLEFNEPIDPEFANVRIAVNGTFSSASVEVAAGVVTATPPERAVQRGTDARWTVAYRVVSEDGHPVVGTVKFVVAAAGDAVPSSAADNGSATSSPTDVASSRTSPTDEPAADDGGDGPPIGQIIIDVFLVVLALSALIGTTLWVARGRKRDQGQ
ncbi:copper resistance CopC family protein [Nocardioides aurantiacus]|nr:copper resistance CopC family protein [Nocardioides aurantiacus]